MTCGRGEERRTATCQNVITGQMSMDESFCSDHERPTEIRQCNTGVSCPGKQQILTYETRQKVPKVALDFELIIHLRSLV